MRNRIIANRLIWIILFTIITACGRAPVHIAYIPLIQRHRAPLRGSEIWPPHYYPELVGQLDLVRLNGARWALYDAAPKTYLPSMDVQIKSLTDTGTAVVLAIVGAPAWAREPGTQECGPVLESAIQRYAEFAALVAARYPRVRYFELWNEEDSAAGESYFYGCWGNIYAARYGRLVFAASENIRAVRPDAKIIFGSMMWSNADSAEFLRVAIQNGAGAADIIGFHQYAGYNGAGGWTLNHPTGVIAASIRGIIANKPIWLTETNLLCSQNCDHNYQTAKAAFIRSQLDAAQRAGIGAVFGYALTAAPGWRNATLLDVGGLPLDAWRELVNR